jgi:hypothetical protein
MIMMRPRDVTDGCGALDAGRREMRTRGEKGSSGGGGTAPAGDPANDTEFASVSGEIGIARCGNDGYSTVTDLARLRGWSTS